MSVASSAGQRKSATSVGERSGLSASCFLPQHLPCLASLPLPLALPCLALLASLGLLTLPFLSRLPFLALLARGLPCPACPAFASPWVSLFGQRFLVQVNFFKKPPPKQKMFSVNPPWSVMSCDLCDAVRYQQTAKKQRKKNHQNVNQVKQRSCA